jgi:hypothetical protein
VGGLRNINVDAGCTDTCVLVLDADQEPASRPSRRLNRPRPGTPRTS